MPIVAASQGGGNNLPDPSTVDNPNVDSVLRTSNNVSFIAQRTGLPQSWVASYLTAHGYNVQGSGGQQIAMGAGPVNAPPGYNRNSPTPGGNTSGAGPVGQDIGPSGPGPGGATQSTQSNPNYNDPSYWDQADPGWRGKPFAALNPYEQQIILAQQSTANPTNPYNTGGGTTAYQAAELAQRQAQFEATLQRDIAKQNAVEVDSLQKQLASATGPKDPYAYLFQSRGLLPPQGYKPAGMPLTDAQQQALLAANPGQSMQGIQSWLTGANPPIWAQGNGPSPLGGMPQSLQSLSPAPMQQNVPPTQQAPAQPAPQQPMGKPAGMGVPPVPTMAVGGQVPGPTGTPQLTVLHGGEQVDNNTSNGQLLPNSGQVHPAIAKLMDAISALLSDPDFQQFAGPAGQAATMSKKPSKGKSTKSASTASPSAAPSQMPAPSATPGGIQAMATGGTVGPYSNPLAMPGSPTGNTSGVMPLGGNTVMPGRGTPAIGGSPAGQDQPIMPLGQLDPYSRALYNRMGMLSPYSAQQEMQMGPSGVQAVQNYVGKVEGADVNDYTSLVDRLKPQKGPAQGGDVVGETFLNG